MALTARVVVGPMRPDDVSAVHEIERLSFSTPWPAYAFEQELKGNRLAHYVVARAGERVAGFAGMWLMVDEAHITTFGVHPDWRRQRIGRQLLLNLLDLAVTIGARRMTLEVVGRRARYYTDDNEDALVMTTPELADARMREVVDLERRRLSE